MIFWRDGELFFAPVPDPDIAAYQNMFENRDDVTPPPTTERRPK